MQDNDKCEDPIHELWLIYGQLEDAENDQTARDQLISSARARLGLVVNTLNGFRLKPKSPCSQAANLNCRYRQKDLTLDSAITITPSGFIVRNIPMANRLLFSWMPTTTLRARFILMAISLTEFMMNSTGLLA